MLAILLRNSNISKGNADPAELLFQKYCTALLKGETGLTVKTGSFFEVRVCVLRNHEKKRVWNTNLLLDQSWASKLP